MSNHTTVMGNLLSHLERSDFQKAVREHAGDKRVRTLSTFDLLKTLIYGQATSAFSVREIESSMAVNSSKLYHCRMKPAKRSTLDNVNTFSHNCGAPHPEQLVATR